MNYKTDKQYENEIKYYIFYSGLRNENFQIFLGSHEIEDNKYI